MKRKGAFGDEQATATEGIPEEGTSQPRPSAAFRVFRGSIDIGPRSRDLGHGAHGMTRKATERDRLSVAFGGVPWSSEATASEMTHS
jgi:hypothetical protein